MKKEKPLITSDINRAVQNKWSVFCGWTSVHLLHLKWNWHIF